MSTLNNQGHKRMTCPSCGNRDAAQSPSGSLPSRAWCDLCGYDTKPKPKPTTERTTDQ